MFKKFSIILGALFFRKSLKFFDWFDYALRSSEGFQWEKS